MPRILLPLSLTLLRLLLGPLMLAAALLYPNCGPWLVAGIYLGILSDIFDGILARRLNVATRALRRLDSLADLLFWLCVLAATWAFRPALMHSHAAMILAILLLEASTYLLSFLKFRRDPATHAYSAKIWGLLLLAAFTAILGFNESTLAIPLLFYSYLLAWADGIAILLILHTWQSDIPSFYHALLIRRGLPIRRNPLFHSAPIEYPDPTAPSRKSTLSQTEKP